MSAIWLLGLPGGWLLDDFSLLDAGFPDLLRPRPLTYLSYWVQQQFSGPDAFAYRLGNILLHALAVQFCYRALRRLIGPDRALLAAAIFAVHPLQAGSVLYIFSRPVLLMGLLLWVSLEQWLRGKHSLAFAFYLLALLAKEEAVAFPLFLAALHFSVSRNTRELRWIAAMFALAIASIAGLMLAADRITGSGAGGQAGISAVQYLATQPAVLALYVKQSLWPQFLGLRWLISPLPTWGIALWLIPLGGLVVARRYFASAGWAFWLLAALLFLLPSSSIFPIADLAADRRMYLPIAMLAAALPVFRWQARATLVAIFLVVSGWWSAQYYRQPAALWAATIKVQPGNIEAILQYSRYIPAAEAARILGENPAPNHFGYQTELGRVLLELNRPAEALRAFGRALAIEPSSASAIYNRGVALQALGQSDAATLDFERALSLDPNHQPARQALSRLKN